MSSSESADIVHILAWCVIRMQNMPFGPHLACASILTRVLEGASTALGHRVDLHIDLRVLRLGASHYAWLYDLLTALVHRCKLNFSRYFG